MAFCCRVQCFAVPAARVNHREPQGLNWRWMDGTLYIARVDTPNKGVFFQNLMLAGGQPGGQSLAALRAPTYQVVYCVPGRCPDEKARWRSRPGPLELR